MTAICLLRLRRSAKVTLRNPENAATVNDVPILIDTGADVSLIPQGVVHLLNFTINQDESYELMGFDGNTSVAQVARLDLIFLRRTFKGRFLLINQEWGLLGRYILNHLSLIFDGPRLTWDEQRTVTQ